MTLIFFLGGGGWRGEMENCAYLRKNPGYAPGLVSTCQQTFGRTNSSTHHLREKQSQNQIRTVSILHKDFFPRRTLSASPPNSKQPSVAKLPVSRLPKTRPSSAKTTYNTTYRAALPYKRSWIKGSHLQRNFSCQRTLNKASRLRRKNISCQRKTWIKASRLQRNFSWQRTLNKANISCQRKTWIKASHLRRKNLSCQHKPTLKASRLRRNFSWQRTLSKANIPCQRKTFIFYLQNT